MLGEGCKTPTRLDSAPARIDGDRGGGGLAHCHASTCVVVALPDVLDLDRDSSVTSDRDRVLLAWRASSEVGGFTRA